MTSLAESSERRAPLWAHRWALVPVGLLAAMLVGWALMISLAVRDPGFSLEPDYYAKAVSWDAQQAQHSENARLGWRATVAQAAHGSIEVRLVDAKGLPIEGAHGSVESFYNARASERVTAPLHAASPGAYRALLPLRHAGLWEFRLTFHRGAATFTAVVRRDVATAGPVR
jgi:hypothetical protein